MAITPSFTVAQTAISPSHVVLADTSSGSDGSIASRRIYFQDSGGNYVVPTGTTTSYVAWSYSDSTIDVNLLLRDMALTIIVQWLDSGNTVLYTLSNKYPLSEYNKQFFVYLVQLQGLETGIVNDGNYVGNMGLFWTNIVAGINAVNEGSDIAGAQNCFDRATYMRLRQTTFFS
jgi:hypothetical protein